MSTPRQEVLSKNTRIILMALIAAIVSMAAAFLLMEKLPDVAAVFLIFGAFVAPIVIITCLVRRIRFTRIYCANCGKKYDYEKEVEWEVQSYKTTSSSSGDTASKVANVAVECTCSICGKSKTFYKNVTVAHVNQRGDVSENRVDLQLENYFK